MKHIKDQPFKGQTVVLDDHNYEGCTFQSCNLVFSATGKVRFTKNTIAPDCTFEFRGPASDAVHMLKGIYAMGEAGRQMVLKTFQNIAPDLKQLH